MSQVWQRSPMRMVLGLMTATWLWPGFGCGSGSSCVVQVATLVEDPTTHQLKADGSFFRVQPILTLTNENGMKTVIPGDAPDGEHATFDVTGLPPGTYTVSFDGSCIEGGKANVSSRTASTVQIL